MFKIIIYKNEAYTISKSIPHYIYVRLPKIIQYEHLKYIKEEYNPTIKMMSYCFRLNVKDTQYKIISNHNIQFDMININTLEIYNWTLFCHPLDVTKTKRGFNPRRAYSLEDFTCKQITHD